MTSTGNVMTSTPLIDALEAEEERSLLPAFDLDDAWKLGHFLTERAHQDNLPVLIDVRRGDFVVFRVVLPGATLDQQHWADRKAATVLRMEASSALVAARMAQRRIDPVALGWLDHRFALAPGAVPIRVRGAGIVGVLSISGLPDDADHRLAVSGLQHLLQSSARDTA